MYLVLVCWSGLRTADSTWGLLFLFSVQFSSVWSLSCVWLFASPWTVARQASLPSTTREVCSNSCPSSWLSNHLIPCCPRLLLPSIFPSIRVFSKSQFFTSGGQSIGVSASASVLPMNTQDWFPLGYNIIYHHAFNFFLVPIRINIFVLFCFGAIHIFFSAKFLFISFAHFSAWIFAFFWLIQRRIFLFWESSLCEPHTLQISSQGGLVSLYHTYG